MFGAEVARNRSPGSLISALSRSLCRVLLGAHALLAQLLTWLSVGSSAFFAVLFLGPLTHHFGYPLALLYPSTDPAAAAASLPEVFSITSNPNWRAFRINALICFSFIWASYAS